MAKEEKEIILRTEEVNEILTTPPKWILRWGVSVIFIFIVTGIVLSYFIRYPDVLSAQITLTTLNPPITLVAKTDGKITQLLIKNGEVVQDRQTIAIIENTANYIDVLFLLKSATELMNRLNRTDSLGSVELRDSLMVGELTPTYLSVLSSIKELNLYNELNTYKRQIILLKKDLRNHSDLLAKYRHQETIHEQQLLLSEKDYLRDKGLYENKVISDREFEAKKKDYLSILNNHESMKITAANARIQINDIEKNILQLQIQDYQEQVKLNYELKKSINFLLSEIDLWKQRYVIESPVVGKISFFDVWVANQNIKNGDALFYIIPTQTQKFIGKCVLPSANSGKIALGQKVNVKLDNYPYHENGMLQGRVASISEVPSKNAYAVDVILDQGLKTSYNKTLAYKEQMSGQADIITKNISVMDRIFFNLRKITERN